MTGCIQVELATEFYINFPRAKAFTIPLRAKLRVRAEKEYEVQGRKGREGREELRAGRKAWQGKGIEGKRRQRKKQAKPKRQCFSLGPGDDVIVTHIDDDPSLSSSHRSTRWMA